MPNSPYSLEHVTCMLASHLTLTGQPGGAVVTALQLRQPRRTAAFQLSWDEFIGLPSRLSAEAPERSERERLLARVTTHGFIDDYSGIRISKSGHRFRILRATVWNVSDAIGHGIGQAATFAEWETCA